MKRSPSTQNTRLDGEGEDKPHTFGVQLRKTEERKPRSLSNIEDANNHFKGFTLRKPRSQSTGDVLDDEDPEMDKDLHAFLKKRKAAAERGMSGAEVRAPFTLVS